MDTEDPDYVYLSKEVGAALGQLGMLSLIDEFNLLELLFVHETSPHVFEEHPSELTKRERKERQMWLGFLQVPRLYDDSVGTEFDGKVEERVQNAVDEVQDSE